MISSLSAGCLNSNPVTYMRCVIYLLRKIIEVSFEYFSNFPINVELKWNTISLKSFLN